MKSATSGGLIGERRVLVIGMWSAWLYFAFSVAYAAAAVAAGVALGSPKDPYWVIAEIITVVGAVILVILIAAIHYSAPLPARMFTLTSLGWALIWAALITTVHFIELVVARRIDLAEAPALSGVFGFEWPTLLMGIELLAWHFFFGLTLLFAAFGFQGPSANAVVRIGFRVGGVLCLVGLLGPAVGDLVWRLPGVLGYGVVFPVLCLLVGRVFKQAASSLNEDHAGPSQAAVPMRD